jgi:hypothetical protein
LLILAKEFGHICPFTFLVVNSLSKEFGTVSFYQKDLP